MNKVTTINLNGKAYQIEEAAYTVLHTYLEQAATKLEGNPDKEEIIADLEQAIGEKCSKFLTPHKNVVSAKEIEQVLKEMGPVDGAKDTTEDSSTEGTTGEKSGPKKFYLIREGALWSGVCTGLSAYFDMDLTLVRIIFVALTIITHGAWILVYFIMSMIVPHANTSEEKAAAHGAPFNAQELMNRARENWDHWNKKEWKKNWKEEKRKWKHQRKYEERYYHHNHHSVLDSLVAMVWIVFFVCLALVISHHTAEVNTVANEIASFFKNLYNNLPFNKS